MNAGGATRFSTDPYIPAGSHLKTMHRETNQSRNFLPQDAGLPACPAKQPSFGGGPERPVGPRQDLVHNTAGQPACRRVTLPFPVPPPLGESPARQPNPRSEENTSELTS